MKYYGQIKDPKDPITKEFLESFLADLSVGSGDAPARAGVYIGTFSTDGFSSHFDVTHDLNSKNILYAFFDNSTDEFVFFQGTKPVDVNTLRVDGAELPAGLTFRVIVVAESAVLNGGSSGGGSGGGTSLGAMASAADAPMNGKPHMRQDGGWTEAPAAGGGGGGGVITGEIRFLPFRAGELPTGWYFCNGDSFNTSTPQGQALVGLPANYKIDWGIAIASNEINLPNLYDASGNGYFLRPVDGSTRYPGQAQTDAIRNITGTWSFDSRVGLVWLNTPLGKAALSGAFTAPTPTKINSFATQPTGSASVADLYFDASGSVPVADENRPINIGMTPAIYLGV